MSGGADIFESYMEHNILDVPPAHRFNAAAHPLNRIDDGHYPTGVPKRLQWAAQEVN